jgi:hypothetical protein
VSERLAASAADLMPALEGMAALLAVPAVADGLAHAHAAGHCPWLPARKQDYMFRREGVFGTDVEEHFLGECKSKEALWGEMR